MMNRVGVIAALFGSVGPEGVAEISAAMGSRKPHDPGDPEVAAKLRAERAKRKAENYAKRQPKPKP